MTINLLCVIIPKSTGKTFPSVRKCNSLDIDKIPHFADFFLILTRMQQLMKIICGYYDRSKIAGMVIVYWSVHSSSRRGRDGMNGWLFYPATLQLEYMVIWY